jgi:hypothetical protein
LSQTAFFALEKQIGLPGVLFVPPDSYVDAKNKDYVGIALQTL